MRARVRVALERSNTCSCVSWQVQWYLPGLDQQLVVCPFPPNPFPKRASSRRGEVKEWSAKAPTLQAHRLLNLGAIGTFKVHATGCV